jgi:cation-transporting ATPase 13A1
MYGKVPQDGMICFVLRNGFATKQGKLMRTILDTTGRATVESKEAYVFLFILFIFALIASGYVLNEGLKNTERNRYKLLLRCIIILTSVVPPELPMELSLAVNYSMIELIKNAIFATEPFRIPLAGMADICCFDKTGTLTSNDLEVKGCAGLDESDEITPIVDVEEKNLESLYVIGGCHTLTNVDGKIIGDPLERSAFEVLKWNVDV